MRSKLLAALSIAALAAGSAAGAYAADMTQTTPDQTTAPGQTTTDPANSAATQANPAMPGSSATGDTAATGSDWRKGDSVRLANGDISGKKLIGLDIAASGGTKEQANGDVEDVVVSENGDVSYVVIKRPAADGKGDEEVAVKFDDLTLTPGKDGAITASMSDAQRAEVLGYLRKDNWLWKDDVTVQQGVALSDMIGSEVDGPDGNQVASIDNVVINEDGTVKYVVIDHGGFLNIGNKKTALNFNELTLGQGDANYTVSLTSDQLDAAPEYDEDNPSATAPAADGGSTPQPVTPATPTPSTP
ncbi:PRC-barrel domain-containing protein [Radicibacter daui]|uniref:PRC-barrel domain-containing protein n=1 Tax=Radicibacter daui TaxID=3064829 RepID=UPI0040469663